MTTFTDFELDTRILYTVQQQGLVTPTPIQAEAIPVALQGNDVVGIAQTGTGKTLGFTLPSIHHLCQKKHKPNRMLVLVPTRELCTQVQDVVHTYGDALGLRATPVYGGVNFERQQKKLKQGCDIIVATPGRLLDHMSRGYLKFDNLEILVLDEADRMLDMGFLPDIQRIIQKMPRIRQTLMFSATFPDAISRLTQNMMSDPVRVEVGAIFKPVDKVRQVIYPVRQEDKMRLITELLDEIDATSSLIFLRTKIRTDQLATILEKRGFNIAQIHGDRSQGQRKEALDDFRSGKVDILVATDVAARGLDIEGVSHVINYDIPLSSDDYIHRVGRTARAERDGDAITLVSPEEFQALGAIERALGHNIPRVEWGDPPPVISVFRPTSAKSSRKTVRKGKRGGGRLMRRR